MYNKIFLTDYRYKIDALFESCSNGDLDYIKRYVEFRGDVNAANKCGDTVLMLAIKNNNMEMAQYLVEHGANPYLTNECDECALDKCKSERSRKQLADAYNKYLSKQVIPDERNI